MRGEIPSTGIRGRPGGSVEPVRAAGAPPAAAQFVFPLDGVELPHAQAFEEWKASAGGNWILERLYVRAARFGREFVRSGRRVSIRLLWELVRHFDLKRVRELHGVRKVDGFAMNDHFHAHAARHIARRRPEWAGMFEGRELHKPRRVVRRITVEEFGTAKGAKVSEAGSVGGGGFQGVEKRHG